MSHIEQACPAPIDRLGLLLDHAQALALAGTNEDFPTMNARAILNFNDALFHVVADARVAFEEMLAAEARTP